TGLGGSDTFQVVGARAAVDGARRAAVVDLERVAATQARQVVDRRRHVEGVVAGVVAGQVLDGAEGQGRARAGEGEVARVGRVDVERAGGGGAAVDQRVSRRAADQVV